MGFRGQMRGWNEAAAQAPAVSAQVPRDGYL
jgi:hypothetical protein